MVGRDVLPSRYALLANGTPEFDTNVGNDMASKAVDLQLLPTTAGVGRDPGAGKRFI